MKWTRIAVKTKAEAADIVISAFYDIGLEGAQIEEEFPAKQEDDDICLNFFIEDNKLDIEVVLPQLKAELAAISVYANIGEGTVTLSVTDDEEWIDNWKEYFHAFFIDDLWVLPAWEAEPKEKKVGQKVLRIDPGTSFGTGAHETTNLCIRQMVKYITTDTVMLDVGCGSGILGIAALLYGVKQVKGTDIALSALEATAYNCAANNIAPEEYEVALGDLLTDQGLRESIGYECYDMVTANILPDVLLPLFPIIYQQLRTGGVCIVSGIIDEKETVMREAICKTGLKIIEVAYQGEWVSITAEK